MADDHNDRVAQSVEPVAHNSPVAGSSPAVVTTSPVADIEGARARLARDAVSLCDGCDGSLAFLQEMGRDILAILADYDRLLALSSKKAAPEPSLPLSDGWVSWFSGDRPVDRNERVDIRLSASEHDQTPEREVLDVEADAWGWRWEETDPRIIAYRIASPSKDPTHD